MSHTFTFTLLATACRICLEGMHVYRLAKSVVSARQESRRAARTLLI